MIHGTRKATTQGRPTSAEDGRNQTRDRLRSLMRPDLQLTVATWQGMGPTEAPHHRWVATPVGAVTLDRGFGSDGKTNNCQALPREAAAMKWATFSRSPYSDSPYEFLDEVTLLWE